MIKTTSRFLLSITLIVGSILKVYSPYNYVAEFSFIILITENSIIFSSILMSVIEFILGSLILFKSKSKIIYGSLILYFIISTLYSLGINIIGISPDSTCIARISNAQNYISLFLKNGVLLVISFYLYNQIPNKKTIK